METAKSLGKFFWVAAGIAIVVFAVLWAFGWRPTSVGIEAGPLSVELSPATPLPTARNSNSAEEIQVSPTPVLTEKYQTLSLEPYSELAAPETNLGLAPGQYSLSDVPFSVGWKVSTQCSHIPERPQSVLIETSISNPRMAYFLLQAGFGWSKFRDKKIGEIVFHFNDGSTSVTSLSLGYNIRDWARDDDNSVVTLAFSPDLVSVWSGTAPDGRQGGIDMLAVRIPPDKTSLSLSGIEIVDLSQSTVGDLDPCIHLLAITVKYVE
ncbi:hypothetical protein D6833_12520 [Candidatus Parcubacteria bacterium]|nr:MAG: hypothetical protein D6833_12520 [Candidatus Parcubacteria bacterium]